MKREIDYEKLSIDERIFELDALLQSFVGLPKTPETVSKLKSVLNKYYNDMINAGHYTYIEAGEFLDKLSLLKVPSYEVCN